MGPWKEDGLLSEKVLKSLKLDGLIHLGLVVILIVWCMTLACGVLRDTEDSCDPTIQYAEHANNPFDTTAR